jgi:hypothetical protein
MKPLFTPNTEGIFVMPSEEYHAAPGVSNTYLKSFARSPAHGQAYLANRSSSDTPARVFGSMVHQMALEPHLPPFWAVMPEGLDGRTTAGKEWKAKHADKKCVNQDTWKRALGCIDAITNHPEAALAIKNSQKEVSCFMRHPAFASIMRKARIDIVGGIALGDIKTTDDAREEAFMRQIGQLRYAMQAAYYIDLWNDLMPSEPKTHFAFIAVEDHPIEDVPGNPHGIMVYRLSDKAIEHGRVQYTNLLIQYADCQRNNAWPCYPTDPVEINLPRWAMKEAA